MADFDFVGGRLILDFPSEAAAREALDQGVIDQWRQRLRLFPQINSYQIHVRGRVYRMTRDLYRSER